MVAFATSWHQACYSDSSRRPAMANVENARTALAIPKDKYRWNQERNCWEINISVMEPDPNNPRENLGNDKKKLKSIMESIRSEDYGGVHLPVSGYIIDGKFRLIEGHRRLFACVNIVAEL